MKSIGILNKKRLACEMKTTLAPTIHNPQSTIHKMDATFDRLWPICRSITGPGYRESLDILSETMPMERHRFATGQKVFDWTVPKEWLIRDAYLRDQIGRA